jgi:monoamine oxidase
VVVVGAGLAGLACAWRLAQLGFQVTVFEARDRLGGRVFTIRDTFVDGREVADVGAEFVAANHAQTRALLHGFRIGLGSVWSAPTVYRAGRRLAWEDFVTPRVDAEVRSFRSRLTGLRPAPSLDARSAAWLIRDVGLNQRARFVVEHDLRDAYGVEPDNLSLLFLVQQARVGRGMFFRSFRVRGGADLLATALADRLDVQLETRVRTIERRRGGFTVAAGGDELDCDHCVVSVPVPVLPTIEFDPGLPPVLVAATERLQYGHGVKTLLQYDRSVLLVGGVLSDLTFDSAWRSSDRVVTTYATGRKAVLLGSVSRRTRPLLAADELGEAIPGSLGHYELGDTVAWQNDGWSLGTAVAYAPTQARRFQQALRRPLGRLHFAGEHTDDFAGTMEGAVRSGLRAAAAVASDR